MTGDPLVDFLLARITEEEAVVRGAMHLGCVEQDDDPDDAIHGVLCVGRVLAECKAKRALLAYATAAEPGTRGAFGDGLRVAVACLGLAYTGHPDYRDEYRP